MITQICVLVSPSRATSLVVLVTAVTCQICPCLGRLLLSDKRFHSWLWWFIMNQICGNKDHLQHNYMAYSTNNEHCESIRYCQTSWHTRWLFQKCWTQCSQREPCLFNRLILNYMTLLKRRNQDKGRNRSRSRWLVVIGDWGRVLRLFDFLACAIAGMGLSWSPRKISQACLLWKHWAPAWPTNIAKVSQELDIMAETSTSTE